MIELALAILMISVNGTDNDDDGDWLPEDDNSTRSGCDYYGGMNLRDSCPREFCPPNAFGEDSGFRDLLGRDPRCNDCPTGYQQDLLYRSWCDGFTDLLEPDREQNDTDDDDSEFYPDE